MDTRIDELIKQGNALFEKRSGVMSFWQDVADNFYVERASFTRQNNDGEDFAAHLSTSFPLLVRRDLGNSISAMLRPSDRDWFKVSTTRPEREDRSAKAWMEYAGGVMLRAMRDRQSQFMRATKEGDHDFATFGNTAISVELARSRDRLLYRCWHLRDVAWLDDAEGNPTTVHRRWKPTARDLASLFPGKVHSKVTEQLSPGKNPQAEFNCRHIVMPSANYGAKKFRTPFVSVFIDVDNQHVMEERGLRGPFYIIPRWHLCGSQYAVSPAVVVALPEARLVQAMTWSLREAGEFAVRPPLLLRNEVVREDVPWLPGGFTWIDAEYDERLGEAIRPLIDNDGSGIPFGRDMLADSRSLITEAFYLNKLGLPPVEMTRDMTAFETGQRVQEYIRNALPLFEPLESEYNGQLCDATFELLLMNGAMGPLDDIPQSLRGADVQWRFESPLRSAVERQKAAKFMEAQELLAASSNVDPTVVEHLDIHTAFREALEGVGVPAKWMKDEKAAAQGIATAKQQQQTAQAIAATQAVGTAAEQVGKGAGAVSEAQMMEEAA